MLTSPLTHILDNCITKQVFPLAWKVARINAIPKVNKIKTNNDLRSNSILPELSKVHERIVLKQMANFSSNAAGDVLKDSVSAYRKGHTVNLRI